LSQTRMTLPRRRARGRSSTPRANLSRALPSSVSSLCGFWPCCACQSEPPLLVAFKKSVGTANDSVIVPTGQSGRSSMHLLSLKWPPVCFAYLLSLSAPLRCLPWGSPLPTTLPKFYSHPLHLLLLSLHTCHIPMSRAWHVLFTADMCVKSPTPRTGGILARC
jgi:hypothetical protein